MIFDALTIGIALTTYFVFIGAFWIANCCRNS